VREFPAWPQRLFHDDFVDVAPNPILTRLERPYQRVVNGVEMFGGVLILGRVTAADVSTREAQTKMNPSIAGLQTLLATVGFRSNFVDLFQVGATGHARLLSSSV
jgi:hypothetical protein